LVKKAVRAAVAVAAESVVPRRVDVDVTAMFEN